MHIEEHSPPSASAQTRSGSNQLHTPPPRSLPTRPLEVARRGGPRGATHPSPNRDAERKTLLRPSAPRGDGTCATSEPRLRPSATPPASGCSPASSPPPVACPTTARARARRPAHERHPRQGAPTAPLRSPTRPVRSRPRHVRSSAPGTAAPRRPCRSPRESLALPRCGPWPSTRHSCRQPGRAPYACLCPRSRRWRPGSPRSSRNPPGCRTWGARRLDHHTPPLVLHAHRRHEVLTRARVRLSC